MASELSGTRVAFLTANEGVEQVELTAPWQAVKDAGGTPELLAPQAGEVQGFNHVDKAETFTAHRSLRDADPLDYSALVLPGGVVNADELRMVPAAVTFVQRIFEAGKLAAVICHGPWALVEAEPGPGPDADLMAELEDRHPPRRGQLGRHRGPGLHQRTEHPGDQPEARRPARILRAAGQGVARAVPARLGPGPRLGPSARGAA